MKIDKKQLTQKEKETFDKIQRAIKKDKKKGEEFLERFTKMLQKKKSKAVKSPETKKTTKTPKTPKSTSTPLAKDIARIEKELGVNKKEATRIAKSKRKNTKGKSESVSQLIARFKKQFAIPPNAQRDFKKDGKIPAKTAVKRKSPTYGKKGGAKKPFYYEYRMNRRDNSNVPVYLEEGGEVLNIITFDNKASRDEFLKEMNFVAPDNSLLILDDVSVQNMGAKSDVDFYNERAKSFNGEFYAKGGEIEGLNIYFDENYTDKKEVEDIIRNIGIIDEKEHIYDYGDAIFIYADDVPADYLKDIYEDILKSDLDVESIELFKKGGKIGFEALSDKVAKRYEGKKVPSKFRDEYGEKYDKKEAKEVGDKVAAKVYRQQQAKMAKGGEVKPFTIKFKHKGKEHQHTFTPDEPDWWTSFESNGNFYDVNYDEDYKHIVVYEYSDKGTDYTNTVYKKELDDKDLLFLAKGGDIEVLKSTADALEKGSKLHKKQSKELAKASSAHYIQSKELDRIAKDLESKKMAEGGEVKFGIEIEKSVYNDDTNSYYPEYSFETGFKTFNEAQKRANIITDKDVRTTIYEYAKGGEIEFEHGGSTDIANTILQQMGGIGRLRMFTGAKNFVALPNGVSFRIGNRSINYLS